MSERRMFFYLSDGSPEMETEWHCGRRLGRTHVESWSESKAQEGEHISVHVGFGSFREYKVVAADDRTMLVQWVPYEERILETV